MSVRFNNMMIGFLLINKHTPPPSSSSSSSNVSHSTTTRCVSPTLVWDIKIKIPQKKFKLIEMLVQYSDADLLFEKLINLNENKLKTVATAIICVSSLDFVASRRLKGIIWLNASKFSYSSLSPLGSPFSPQISALQLHGTIYLWLEHSFLNLILYFTLMKGKKKPARKPHATPYHRSYRTVATCNILLIVWCRVFAVVFPSFFCYHFHRYYLVCVFLLSLSISSLSI